MMGLSDFGWSMGFGAGIFGWFLMIIFWGAFIWLIFWLIKQNIHTDSNKGNKDNKEYISPKNILKSRYANGEITSKEFHEMKKELEYDSIF